MNCIRCQAPLRKQMETEVGIPVASCISCRSLWFEKDEIRLALGVRSLGSTSPEAHIGFDCPSCPSSELANYQIEGVELPIISCPKCAGAWLDGGEFAKIKMAVKDAGMRKEKTNPNANPHLSVQVPVNNAPKEVPKDWLPTVASAFFVIGVLFFAYWAFLK